ncbi:hypothetical protein FISHEDRAFT_60542 [Fistulina hepatica ATCC 64428]|uniref:Uncharacterized protein n=1 Tax=Fistulina hepatica ATCC 64428 TaxID=1128425 RepID=A0A0D7A5Q1_9AGAR|nr:hypothetical protein FISHEDRAFT_60542 [Fistulina hepatica ATCC 64428]
MSTISSPPSTNAPSLSTVSFTSSGTRFDPSIDVLNGKVPDTQSSMETSPIPRMNDPDMVDIEDVASFVATSQYSQRRLSLTSILLSDDLAEVIFDQIKRLVLRGFDVDQALIALYFFFKLHHPDVIDIPACTLDALGAYAVQLYRISMFFALQAHGFHHHSPTIFKKEEMLLETKYSRIVTTILDNVIFIPPSVLAKWYEDLSVLSPRDSYATDHLRWLLATSTVVPAASNDINKAWRMRPEHAVLAHGLSRDHPLRFSVDVYAHVLAWSESRDHAWRISAWVDDFNAYAALEVFSSTENTMPGTPPSEVSPIDLIDLKGIWEAFPNVEHADAQQQRGGWHQLLECLPNNFSWRLHIN